MIAQLKQHKCYYLTLAVAAIVFMAMNVFTTLKGDEYVYAMMPGDTQLHCRTLADYVSSIPTFYQTTNGRLADALERLMASLVGKPVFNLLNTIMFILFVEGICMLEVSREALEAVRDELAQAAHVLVLCREHADVIGRGLGIKR